jgi:hypothetical protein
MSSSRNGSASNSYPKAVVARVIMTGSSEAITQPGMHWDMQSFSMPDCTLPFSSSNSTIPSPLNSPISVSTSSTGFLSMNSHASAMCISEISTPTRSMNGSLAPCASFKSGDSFPTFMTMSANPPPGTFSLSSSSIPMSVSSSSTPMSMQVFLPTSSMPTSMSLSSYPKPMHEEKYSAPSSEMISHPKLKPVVPTNQIWLKSLSDKNIQAGSYWIVEPQESNKTVKQIKEIAVMYQSARNDHTPAIKTLLFCNVSDQYYFEALAPFTRNWQLEVLGLKGVSAAMMVHLMPNLDFTQIKKIGITGLKPNALWQLLIKLLDLEEKGFNNISIVCENDIPQESQQAFADLKIESLRNTLIKKNYNQIYYTVIQALTLKTTAEASLRNFKEKVGGGQGDLISQISQLEKVLDGKAAQISQSQKTLTDIETQISVAKKEKELKKDLAKLSQKLILDNILVLKKEVAGCEEELDQVKKELTAAETNKRLIVAEQKELEESKQSTELKLKQLRKELTTAEANKISIMDEIQTLKRDSVKLGDAKIIAELELKQLGHEKVVQDARVMIESISDIFLTLPKVEDNDFLVSHEPEAEDKNAVVSYKQTQETQEHDVDMANDFLATPAAEANNVEVMYKETQELLEERIAGLKKEVSSLTDQVQQKTVTITKLRTQLAEQDQRLSEQTTQQKKFVAENATLLIERNKLQQEKITLEAEKSELSLVAAELKEEKKSLDEKVNHLTDDSKSLAESLDDLANEFGEVQGVNAANIVKLKAFETNSQKLMDEITELNDKMLKRKLDIYVRGSEATTRENSDDEETAKKDRKKAKKEIVSLRAQLNESTKQAQMSRAQADAFEEKNKEHTQTLFFLHKSVASLTTSSGTSSGRLKRSEEIRTESRKAHRLEIRKLEAEKQALREKVEALQKKLDEEAKIHAAEIRKLKEDDLSCSPQIPSRTWLTPHIQSSLFAPFSPSITGSPGKASMSDDNIIPFNLDESSSASSTVHHHPTRLG